jgi:hypothetical protein
MEIKRIGNNVSRLMTFSKRKVGLLKKAHVLVIDVLVFFTADQPFEYCSPYTRYNPMRSDLVCRSMLTSPRLVCFLIFLQHSDSPSKNICGVRISF